MNTETQIKLNFLSVDFPIVNFQSEKPFNGEKEITINIDPKVYFPKNNPNSFKIIQEVRVYVEGFFNIDITGIGSFEMNNLEGDEKLKHSFVNINAPAIMFPYIRSFISTFTANLGNVIGTLNIPPQFFKGKLPVIPDED